MALCMVFPASLLAEQPEAAWDAFKPLYHRPETRPYRELPFDFDRQKLEELGKKLFFDPRLSRSGLVSCATCHNPSLHWTDGLPISVEGNSRRSMTLYNLAWDKRFTWIGRSGNLMSQALLAFTAPKGMGIQPGEVVAKILEIKSYRPLFDEIYREHLPESRWVTIEKATLALEHYVNTIVSPEAPFDRWIAGDEEAISSRAKRGFMLFNTTAQCSQCHSSWRFSDSTVHDIGLNDDPGLYELFGQEEYRHHFKTVGLREIGDRPPYMHDGSIGTLREVLDFYNRGGNRERSTKSPFIRALDLEEQEVQDLLEFLNTLSSDSEKLRVRVPMLPR